METLLNETKNIEFNYTSIFTLKNVEAFYSKISSGSCTSVGEFEKVCRLGEGTYGIVYKGIHKKNGNKVALKQIRMELEKDQKLSEGISISIIREIYALTAIPQHENIVRLFDIAVGQKLHKIFLVMEYCHQDLATLLDNMKSPFTESQIKCLLKQLFCGLKHLHNAYLIHRDIKVSNLLLTQHGILKIADFGLARLFGNPSLKMTAHVVTLWYRSPELLLNSKFQSTAIDMWACGCIMGELFLHKPLFPGNGEIDQLRRIINLLGTPTERIWPGIVELKDFQKIELPQQPFNNIKMMFPDVNQDCLLLLNRLFAYDPQRRISAKECLESNYFKVLPLPCNPTLIPSLSNHSKKKYL